MGLDRIQGGDTVCAANQDLHPEAADLLAKTRRNNFYRPKVADPLRRSSSSTRSTCRSSSPASGPTSRPAATARRWSPIDRYGQKWFTFTNGVHTDSLDPETFNRWYDFMQIYVAKQKPEPRRGSRRGAGDLFSRCSASRA